MNALRRSCGRVALVGLVAVLAGMTVLAPVSLAETGDDSSVTVAAPAAGDDAQVTVSQTQDLVDQTVHVSWTGFKPSSGTKVVPGSTMYVVRVYQCRGADPASAADCYGSKLYTYESQSDSASVLPDGPGNARDAVTSPDGSGAVDIEVRTKLESSSLGCTSDSACSVVVVPNYGNGHRGSDLPFATTDHMDNAWAWARHVAVPLHLAVAGATCPLGVPGVITVGAPMLQRAVTSWQPAACTAEHPVNADYTALGEPQARDRYESSAADLAYTTLPADTARPTVYAPVSVSGISVAFHVDDAVTGQPITAMKLTARLVAKLITQSYGGTGFVAPGQPLGNANPATAGNPFSIYTDPDFLALNPGPSWPTLNPTNPLLLAGNSDLTWELTRWIDDDPTARAWLDGADDGHGMKVNTNFKGIDYPASSLETRDPYPKLTYTFVPINGLDHVARSLVADQPSSSAPEPDIFGLHPRDPQQLPGSRALIAIIDTADSSAFNAPEAQLANATGAFVGPTSASLGAAVAGMNVDPANDTRLVDHASRDAAAYPLAMVHYAMAPTGDLTTEKADQVARVLDYAGGPGQQQGRDVGELPGGYLPLPDVLHQQLTAAAAAVRSQSGTPAPVVTPPTAGPSGSGSGVIPSSGYGNGQVGGGAAVAAADPVAAATTASAAPEQVQARATAASAPLPAGLRLWWPVALVATALAGVVGPLLVAHGAGLLQWLVSPRRRRSA